MFGVLIAAAVVAFNYFFQNFTLEAAFLGGTNVLWILQLIFTGITALFVLGMLLGVTGVATLAGAGAGRVLGGVAGFAAGGLVSLLMLVPFVLTRGMLLGGTWLLGHSGTADMTFAEFDQVKLFGGGILLVLGLLSSRFTASVSTNNSTTSTSSSWD